MRKIMSLSLPKKYIKDIKSLAKTRGFSSVSAYMKYLVEQDKELIGEKELLNSIREARKEYREGKAIEADSIADLL